MCKSKAILKLTKTAKQWNIKLTNGDPGILFDGDCLLFEDPIGRLIPAEDDEDLQKVGNLLQKEFLDLRL